MNKTKPTKNRFPRGWDEARVQKLLKHYENQTPEEAIAEDEAALARDPQTVMKVPSRLVPAIRKLIASRK
jgi:hypothetical protein